MKKVLFFLDQMDTLALEEAVIQLESGNSIYFVQCDKSVGICRFNRGGLRPYCQLCRYSMSSHIKELKSKYPQVEYKTVTQLCNPDVFNRIKEIRFNYNTVQELKDLQYKNVDIGYAAFSTFVSQTRNIYPSFTPTFYSFIDSLLQSEVLLIEVLSPYIDKISPDLIVFHNGRFSTLKPIYNLAVQKGIDYIATEHVRDQKGLSKKNNTFNNIPHSAEVIKQNIERYWDEADEIKYKISKEFFENRRFGKYAGDKLYTKDQIQGAMPEGFDSKKMNVAIFNSSEDEYFSLSKEFDQDVLFPDQLTALTTIFEHYKDNTDIHFYLRIHPNLADVTWKSHTQLYNLKYNNVTIIPPKSPISSYTLMDNCDKVLVFDSTMGVESSYWGKPVIVMCHTYYTELGIGYRAYTKEELYRLIDDANLQARGGEGCLKCAFRYSKYPYEKLRYYPDYENVKLLFGRVKLVVRSQYKVLNSSYFLGLLFSFMSGLMHVFGKSKNLAKLTE